MDAPETTIRGESVTLDAQLSVPLDNVNVFFVISSGLGSGICPPILGGDCLDLAAPVTPRGPRRTTGGAASVSFTSQMSTADIIAVQAVAIRSGAVLLSPPVVLEFVDPVDSDLDGLWDHEEADLGTDPNLADTDGDGLTDGDEVQEHGTDPLSDDTDGDSLGDFDELFVYETDPLSDDTDEDGLTDGLEVTLLATDPLASDTDGDGLADGEEIALSSATAATFDPLKIDSDGDGIRDGAEQLCSSDDVCPDGWCDTGTCTVPPTVTPLGALPGAGPAISRLSEGAIPGRVYMGGDALFVSDDFGESWTVQTLPEGGFASTVAAHPEDNDVVAVTHCAWFGGSCDLLLSETAGAACSAFPSPMG